MASPRRRKETESGKGYFAYEGLDRVLHEKARLGILTALRTRPDGLVFGELKELCSLTDGNLSRHLSVLAEGALVSITKELAGRRPQTFVQLTASGRQQFDRYLEELQRVIQDASIRMESERRGEADEGLAPA